MSDTKVQLQTKHKKTLSELERYKMLVENVQDYAIFLMDPNGYIQTWNKGAEKTKGYKSEEIIGKHFSLFYSQQDNDDNKPAQELEIAKKLGRVEDEDWRIRKDGTKFWANVVITALYDEDKVLQGFAKVTRNLTERKENEDSLRSANALLREQQKELKKLNESKDEFISLASHQLRTPATVIKQLLGVLIEGYIEGVPESIMDLLQKTYDSNERQISIVNSLLKVAHIDSGKIKLRKQPTEINRIIDDVLAQYRSLIDDRNQTICTELSQEKLLGEVDEQYFRMIIENILDNASKYTCEKGEITIRTDEVPGFVRVHIKDTGVGILPENIPTLFDKFQRIPNELSHKVAGSGLGLYWVKKVIELHDGKINVHSKYGEGTTFIVQVPKKVS